MDPLAISCFLVSITSLLLGIAVYLKNIKALANKMWGMTTLSMAIWSFGLGRLILAGLDADKALFWDRFLYVGAIFIPVFYLHFVSCLLELHKLKKKIIISAYGIGCLFLFVNFTTLFRKGMTPLSQINYLVPKPGILYYPFVAMFVACMIYIHYVMFKAYTDPNLPRIRKNQIKYLFIGTVITFIGGSTNFLPPLGINVYPIGNYFVIVFIFMASYSIIKYRLMDIETVIHKIIGYILASSLIVLLFAGIFIMVQKLIPKVMIYDPFITGLLFLIFLFIFIPLRDRIQTGIDRLFYREKYEHRKFFAGFVKKLGRLISLRKLLATIVNVTADTMHIDKVSIALIDENSKEYAVKESRGLINSSVRLDVKNPFFDWLRSYGELIEKEQIKINPLYKNIKSHGIEIFTKLEAEICIPLIVEHKMIGLINLNKKISGDIYKKEDLELLSTLGKQAAMSINNALSYNSLKVRSEQLEALSGAGQAIASSLNLETILATILDQIKDILGAEICSILLVDENTTELTIKASFGLEIDIIKSTRLKVGERISGWVAENNQSLLIANIEKDPRFGKTNHEKYYTKSLISVPLIVKNKVIGIINVNNKRNKEIFTPYDLEVLKGISSQAAVSIENARLYEDLRNSYMNNVQSLAHALDAKDPYTQGHVFRVGDYAIAMGKRLGLNNEYLDNLKTAAHLHDIGKIGISDLILHKPAKLTEEEYKKIKEHPEISEQIVAPIGLPDDVLAFIRHHHERMDGKGYPDGLKGEETPLGARILAVADSYDAMMSDRPYRKALSEEVVIKEIEKCKGTQFDPNVADVFIKYLKEEKKRK